MKLEKTLVEMVCHFTPARASDWLRILFSSFETDLEPIAVDTTKNESAYFAEARRLGWVTHLPETDSAEAANKPLVVVAVRIKGDLTERTSRLVQFAFAKKVVQNAIARGCRGIHGLPTQGLFFFYDADGYFRISLVHGEADGRKLKYNSAKRQSFYVDPTAANNILRRRLGDTIKTFSALKNAFSVEQLTKEFYGRLFEWYTWALAPRTGVTFPNDLADEKDDRKYNHEAIIRLITRLMFTWFIRQKIPALKELFERERVAELLSKFEPGSMEQDNYYRCILQNLFFATFNCQPAKRAFIHIFQGKTDQRHITTLYRYEKEFKGKDGSRFKELMKTVPFLNCALFDCLDKIERKEDGGHKLYFDGFSGEKGFSAHVPNGLFFKEGRGIIDLFNGYEFTIDENSADDADVALDPELLGKVFENLLGAFNPETQETARKATGSFYTPREIVDYMVEESLKNYLKGRLPDTTKDIDPKLDDLFDRTKAAEGGRTMFSRKDEETLLDALYDCKVLDPACGSGAFPMGVLHCMVRLLARLDPDSISIRERLIARYRADKDSVDPSETASDRRERLSELEKCLDEGQHYPDYARKLYLIENCIYGVDIQPIATQISKLRFFISLLCDQFRTSFNGEDANYGLLALPNLEAKFVCANTLISLPETSGELDLTASGVMEARQRLKINRHRIFGARSTGTKEKYKKRDLEIRDEIRDAVINALARPDESIIAASTLRVSELLKERENYEEPRMVKQHKKVAKPLQQFSLFDALSPVKGKQEFEEEVEVLVDKNESKRQSIDSQITIERMKIAAEQEKANASNVSAAQNYAALVAGWDPFDQNASSKFFDPEWMFNVTDGFDVVIGNPPYRLCQPSNTDSELLELYKQYQVASYKIDLFHLFFEKGLKVTSRKGLVTYITSNTYLTNKYMMPLRRYILSNSCVLQLVMYPDGVFDSACVEAATILLRKQLTHEVSYAIPICFQDETGTKILRFKLQTDWENDRECVFNVTDNAVTPSACCIDLGKVCNTYFGIQAYDKKASTSDVRLGKEWLPIIDGSDLVHYGSLAPHTYFHYVPSEIKSGGDSQVYSRERVLVRQIGTIPFVGYVESGVLTSNTIYNIYVTDERFSIKYILGILSSSFVQYIWKCRYSDNKKLFPKIKGYQLRELPIPDVGKKEQRDVVSVVEKIIEAKKTDPSSNTTSLEDEINTLVYKLYGLTDDEIAIVEGRDESKQEPQGETARRHSASPRRRIQSPAPAASDSTDDEVLE